MLLIGSAAFYYHKTGSLDGFSKDKDIDFICTEKEFEDLNLKESTKRRRFSATHSPENDNRIDFLFSKDPTDIFLLDKYENGQVVRHKGYSFNVVNIHDLHLIYHASFLALKKPKYNILKTITLTEVDQKFVDDRIAEIRVRGEINFFHKYKGLPEYIRHDDLHEYIAEVMEIKDGPTYKKTLAGITKGTSELWSELNYATKISERVEETCVIYLERYFIPKCIRRKEVVPLVNNGVLEKILHHVNVRGLRDQATYITDFSNDHYGLIRNQVLFIMLTLLPNMLKGSSLEHRINRLINGLDKPYYLD